MMLSVVITTKNRKTALLRCLDSIKASRYEDYDVVIVDDCSHDGTATLTVAELGLPRCKIWHSQNPLMMAKARNTGAKMATGDLLLFVDDDNVVDESMIEILVDAANRHPDYGILGPSMAYAESGLTYLDCQHFNMWTGRTRGIVDSSDHEICDSDGVPNVFLVRRELFLTTGYFDETLVQTFTEPDLAFTARQHGFRCGIVKQARALHDVAAADNLTARALGGRFRQKAYCLMRNRSVLIARYGTGYQKFIYCVFFAWLWPLLYSLLVVKTRQWNLLRLYGYGFRDGLIHLLTGRMVNSLPVLMPSELSQPQARGARKAGG